MTIYSYSKLKCYEQCQRKYQFQYIDKIKIETKESIELFLGKRVHETLKKLYYDQLNNKEDTLEELLSFLREEWCCKWNESIITIMNDYSWKDYLQIAEQCIVDYYHKYYPFDHGRTIAVEKRIIINLDDDSGYKLFGYIDRVSKTKDGCYDIHDYKTASRLPSARCIQNDRQLMLYAMMIKLRYSYIKNIRLVFHYLKFNREFDSTRSNEEFEEFKQEIIQLMDSIESTKDFIAKPSKLCDWCKYKTICR